MSALSLPKVIQRLYDLGGPQAPAGSKPLPEQRKFHLVKQRFKVPVWGRRAGKSFSSGVDATPKMLPVLHTDGFPHVIWIVAPNYELGEREFRVLWHLLIDKLKIPVNYKFFRRGSGGQMAIKTAWGSEVWVKSAERPDSGLLGEGISHVIMSEAARHNRSTWDQYVEPSLSDRGGSASFPTTPQGRNWLKLLFDRGQSAEHPDWWSSQIPSWHNSVRYPGGLRFIAVEPGSKPPRPVLVKGEWIEIPWQKVAADPHLPVMPHPDSNEKLVQSWRTLSRHYFWQEYGAQFRTQAGRVYPEFDPGYHVINYKFVPGRRNYRTIDYGTTNPFVCLDIQVDEADNVYVWREWRRTGHTTLDNVNWCGRPHTLGYALEAVVGDPYEPDGRLTTENEWATPCQFVTIGVKNGIELVQRWLKLQSQSATGDLVPKLYFDRSCTGAIEEFQAYRYKETLDEEAESDAAFQIRDEKNPVEEPLKQNDHAPDCLRNFMAWMYGSTMVHHGVNDEQFDGWNEDMERTEMVETGGRLYRGWRDQ